MRAIEFLKAMEAWHENQPSRPSVSLSEEYEEGGFLCVDAYITDEGGISLQKAFMAHLPSEETKMKWEVELTRDEALKLSEWIREVYAD